MVWLTIIIVGLLTFGTRLSFILVFSSREVPARLRQALRFVPGSVLSAIIFPEVLMPGGTLDLSLDNTRLLAGIAAALIAWRTKNVAVTLVIGMAILLALEALL